MLGIKTLSPGRLGNRLFHYHFLRQIAKKTRVDYFHCRFPEADYFEDMEKKPQLFSPFKKSIELTSKEIQSFSPENFLSFVVEKTVQDKEDIIFKPPILGELFFDYLFYFPNEFIKVKTQYKKDFEFYSKGRIIIGVHFRGTDFPSWNSKAALKFSYYRKAINFCLGYFKEKDPVILLFTDDNQYPPFLETIEFLKKNRDIEFYFGDNSKLPIYDFYQLSQCDVLISSPSTFAIFAGCLGKPKKIIHEKDWLDSRVSAKDKFWVDLSRTKNPYYSIWKTF